MQPAFLVRLRPLGAWRYGSGEGGRDNLDGLYRSDRLFSALTIAFSQFGDLEEWLDATVRSPEPAVRFTSLFPFQADTLFVMPPNTLWPPPARLVTSPSPVFLSKLRWNSASLVPVSLVQSLMLGQPILAEQWVVDAESGCLLRRDRPSSSPYRHAIRFRSAVDRVTHLSSQADSTSCIEFESTSGLWAAIVFSSPEAEQTWNSRIRGALQLLADTGLGAGRRIGWGQFELSQEQRSTWPGLLFPKLKPNTAGDTDTALHWLLSLYSPAASERIDWTNGNYRLIIRGGRVENGNAQGNLKRVVRFVSEGSVLATSAAPVGRAVDVAPEGSPHPVYRAGFALSIQLPEPEAASPDTVEQSSVDAETVTEPSPDKAEPEPEPERDYEI